MELSHVVRLCRVYQFLILLLLCHTLLYCLFCSTEALATGKGSAATIPYFALSPKNTPSVRQRTPAATTNNPFALEASDPDTDDMLSGHMSRLSVSVTESQKQDQLRNSAASERSDPIHAFNFVKVNEEDPPAETPETLEMNISVIGTSGSEEQCFRVIEEKSMGGTAACSAHSAHMLVEPIECKSHSETVQSEVVYGTHQVAVLPATESTFRGKNLPPQKSNGATSNNPLQFTKDTRTNTQLEQTRDEGTLARANEYRLTNSNYSDLTTKSQIVTPWGVPAGAYVPAKPIVPETNCQSYDDTKKPGSEASNSSVQKKPAFPAGTFRQLLHTNPLKQEPLIKGYQKPTYAVLAGNTVKNYNTKIFAGFPRHDTFLVKERWCDPGGVTRVRLALKSNTFETNNTKNTDKSLPEGCHFDSDDADDQNVIFYRRNSTRPGYVMYTSDKRFRGDIKYPLPKDNAASVRIGKGGNGFVFTMYHEKKQYAVKQTVFRTNEVNVHGNLKHENILPLKAVIIGEKNKRHANRLDCFHFMKMMDYDLRQILSDRQVGYLRHWYRSCTSTTSSNSKQWETGFGNIKFILGRTLNALVYLHENGYVHRDVKASNIMLKMNCKCKPLFCDCSNKFEVRLGDFDSSGTVPGLGITEPTDQIIKFASILPLGTPGYRAPEVSMHITLSGPYETLYTTSVDMWSFGCLMLNIAIGKTAALKQREEACLLLSRSHYLSKELWEKTTKINDLKGSKPFADEHSYTKLVHYCLQVDPSKRPSAKYALKILNTQ